MDFIDANTLSLMRRIKPQNESMGHVFQRLFFSGFMPIHNQCSGTKHRIPLLTKSLAPTILIRSMGALEECLQRICVALFLVLASHFSHQHFWLLSTILYTWPMQLLQF